MAESITRARPGDDPFVIADEPLSDWRRIGGTAIDALVRGLTAVR